VTAKLDVVIETLVATPAERMLFKGSAALIPARFVQFWLAPLEQLLLLHKLPPELHAQSTMRHPVMSLYMLLKLSEVLATFDRVLPSEERCCL
jgi:hypothetical protein